MVDTRDFRSEVLFGFGVVAVRERIDRLVDLRLKFPYLPLCGRSDFAIN